MSAAGVQKAIYTITDDFYALIMAVFEDDSISTNIKVNKNTLKESALKYELYIEERASDNVVLLAMFNNYVEFIEWDRPAKYGRQPPIDALKDWAEKNNIDTDANTLWAISYAIWRDGHEGRPIFSTIDKHLDGLFNDDWSNALMAAITDNLDAYFND